ncbi:MAG TPA: hypothetical protein VF899_05810 [Pyrinomonadaceae bacterium]
MADGGDIIIRGGSVDLDYDDSVYPKDPGNPKKHKNNDKKIRQITVTDNGRILFDSGDHPEGLAFTISVLTK